MQKMEDFNNKRNVLHIFIWIFSFVSAWIAFFISDIILVTYDRSNLYAHQFTCAAIYANIAISTCVLVTFLLDEKFPQQTLTIFNTTATITYIIAGGLYVSRYADVHSHYKNANKTAYNLELCNGIFCFFLAILNFGEFLMDVLNRK